MMFEHDSKHRGTLLIIFSILLLSGLVYFLLQNDSTPEPVACTMDAKICPDGSAVGRIPPDCEFAPCPQPSRDMQIDVQGDDENPQKNAIETYLLTENHFSWKTKDASRNFCSIEYLDDEKELFPVHVWSYCSEYTLEGTELKVASGSSGPAKISYPNELSFYDPGRFSYEVPRDGSHYTEDIKTIFPEMLWNRIFNFDRTGIIWENQKKALTWFSSRESGENNLWEIAKQAIQNCEVEQVFQAHSREVSITYKDGRELRAVEPNIDDIIDVAVGAEPDCGRIIMATE